MKFFCANLLFFAALLGTLDLRAQNSGAPTEPTHEELMRSIRAHQSNPEVGERFFADLTDIIPGQRRYSLENVWKHMREYMEDYGLSFRRGFWQLPNDDGTILPLKEALPVVRTSRGLMLVDGHHHALACLAVGCRRMPVRIVRDISNLPRAAQARVMRRYANYSGLDGKWRQIDSFLDMVDDPMLMVVRSARLRLEMNEAGEIRAKGSDHAAWVAFRGDNFPEIRVAEVLRRSGYRIPANYRDKLAPEEIEKIRKILEDYTAKNPRRIRGIEVVTRQMLEEGIDHRAVFQRHRAYLQNNPCIPNFERIAEFLGD